MFIKAIIIIIFIQTLGPGSTEQSTQTQEKKEVKYMIHINGAMTILFSSSYLY